MDPHLHTYAIRSPSSLGGLRVWSGRSLLRAHGEVVFTRQHGENGAVPFLPEGGVRARPVRGG